MKTFDDLEFRPRTNDMEGEQALMFFDNGYGVSVVRGFGTYGSASGLWEMAVLKGGRSEWSLCCDTPVTDDVLGYLSKSDVTAHMAEVQALGTEVTT